MRLLITLLIFSQSLLAQKPYNHRLENGEIQAFGHIIYEMDSSYLCIGRGFDTLDFIRGAYATEIDKETGEILHTAKYGVQNQDVNFNRVNNIVDVAGRPYFIFHIRDTVFLSTYEDETISVVKKIVSSIPAVSHFLYDFHYKDGLFYVLTDHSLGEMNSLIFIYDPINDTIEEIFFYDPAGFMSSPRMAFMDNDNYLITYRRIDDGIAYQHFREIDRGGNTIWQTQHNVPFENFAQSFIQIDSTSYLLGAGVWRESSMDPDGENIPILMKFDLETKSISTKSYFEIPNNEWHKKNDPVEDMIGSHDGQHYLCVSQLTDFPLNDTIWYTSAMVAKVDQELNLIWKRKYKYIDVEFREHDFQDIIATSDGNYLCYGTALDNYWPPPDIPWLSWVIKIDEDGKIVGDTTTSIVDWESDDLDDQIEIFPNPFTNHININQNDIAAVRYFVFDSNGRLEEEFEIATNYTSILKSVENWSKGAKFIRMAKDGKHIGSLSIIKQ